MYSNHPLPLGQHTFPTAAHLFEAAHYDPIADKEIFELILSATTGHDARLVGDIYKHQQRSVWSPEKSLEVLRGILAIKVAFYPALSELLLATGERQLWDASDPEDMFLGIGRPDMSVSFPLCVLC